MPSSTLAALLRGNPVVITGQGAFSSGGKTVGELWESALAGRSTAVAHFVGEGAERREFPGCAAPAVDVSRIELRPFRKLDRSVQMARVAADEALKQSRLLEAYPPERVGIMVGTARGPLKKLFDAANLPTDRRPPPSIVADNAFAAASGALARAFNLQGPCLTLSATCASAAIAIACAAEQLLLGKADAMLAGGSEAPLQPATFRQFDSAGVLGSHADPAQACRPFDLDRNGLVLGEGSGFLVLETEAAARKRGAVLLARLAGWAYGSGVSSRTGIEISSVVRVMQGALDAAQFAASEVDYINLHGTGTKLNDAAEGEAIAQLFGQHAAVLGCSSTKPVTGHCLGATPAVEAILCVEALKHGVIPPTANCVMQDPACRIDIQTVSARRPKTKVALSNSLGFWGHYASLLLSRAE